jgi:hypothetical protein
VLRSAVLTSGLLLLAVPARGQDDRLTEDHGWPAGTIQEQLNGDSTLIPYGKGAIFVPAMTNPLDEPPVAIYYQDDRIAEGTTGTRLVLSPGTYEVRVGSGAGEQRLGIQATVRERHTTVVPVSWAGLSIHVVDERLGSLRGSYEIIRVDDREYLGIGFGTDEQAGEPVTTWLLKPGLYKIVRVGETYRARRDFATVRLVEGHHTHFLLVQDEAGEFKGGGEVPEAEIFQGKDGFFGSLILGGDLTFNHRDNVPGVTPGISFSFRAFLDARLSVEIFDSPFVLLFQVEEGQTKPPDLPFQKTIDRADLDLLYIYQINDIVGPYIRFGGETNILPSNQNFAEPTRVVLRDPDGTVIEDIPDATDVDLAGPVGLSTLREGAGINLRVFKELWGETTLRAGVGARHTLARGDVYLLQGDESSDDVKYYDSVPTVNRFGAEATVLGVARISRWVLFNLELDTLVPFNGFDKSVLELEASVALKLTSYLSVNYVLRFLLDRLLSDEDQLQQDILLRFSVEVL